MQVSVDICAGSAVVAVWWAVLGIFFGMYLRILSIHMSCSLGVEHNSNRSRADTFTSFTLMKTNNKCQINDA